MRATLSFYLILCGLTLLHPALAQISFKQIPPPEGTTFGVVTGITQDPEGYMWFATNKGLFRYDGYRMYSYKNDPLNPRSLATNHIESVHADAKGIIWIGTFGAGLYRLDPSNGSLINFRHHPANGKSLSNDTVTAILQDSKGNFWIGTNRGLNHFETKHFTFTRFTHNANDSSSISSNQVRSIYEDKQGTLWVGTGSPFPSDGGTPTEGGLNRMDRRTGKFTRYLHQPGNANSLLNNKVRGMLEDSRGNFWVGTNENGLHLMDRKTGTFKRYLYDPAHPDKLSIPYLRKGQNGSGGVTFIHEDATGVIWIGSYYGGLNRYDPRTGKVDHYEADNTDADSYTANGAWWAYTSHDGVLWIGSNEGNLYRVNPFKKNIPHYDYPGAPVNGFFEDASGILWLGTEKGLIRHDRKSGAIQRFLHDPANPSSISSNFIQSIFEDRQGRLWIGTLGAGLNLLNRSNFVFTRYQHDPKKKNSISSNDILHIYQDREGTLWLGTARGLNEFNPGTGTFKHYLFNPKDTNSIGQNSVPAVVADRQGYLWAGTWNAGGLHRLDRKNGRTKNYLTGLNITSLLEDYEGVLWAGSDEGLFRHNATSDEFERFIDPSSAIGINNTSGMVEDSRKNIWLSTYNGIIRISAGRNETSVYDRNYGVIGNNLKFFAAYKSPRDEIFFGDFTGYFGFHPNLLTKNARSPQITFTSFQLGGEVVKPGKSRVLPQPLSLIKEIRLRHNQNVFSFDFAGIDYANPENNRHVYMLENFDDTWHYAGTDRRAYYFNVPPGHYIFRVKAANSDGMWAEKKVAVIITPPWWRTWWAYILFALLVTAGIWAVTYYRSYALIKEKHILEEKIASRTAEVVKQKEEIKVQRDNLEQVVKELKATQSQLVQKEKMASLGELTAGIAHEIQNPLNFVNNFSEISIELVNELKSGMLPKLPESDRKEASELTDNLNENLKKVAFHGRRADSIVKSMLQHSRTEAGKMEHANINILTDEFLRLAYHGMRAKDKSFNATLKTDFDDNISYVKVVRQDIGRVLLNLFNNAFYAVMEKKKKLNGLFQPTITVCTSNKNGAVEIRIRDNGTGIPQKVVDKIYQPFFTTKPAGEGTGLGLSLSYDIITKGHGGELKVDTKEGEYAEFVIQLPASTNGN